MKLNHDCVRLLLLEIESIFNKKIGEPLTRHNFNDNILDKYDFETSNVLTFKIRRS